MEAEPTLDERQVLALEAIAESLQVFVEIMEYIYLPSEGPVGGSCSEEE